MGPHTCICVSIFLDQGLNPTIIICGWTDTVSYVWQSVNFHYCPSWQKVEMLLFFLISFPSMFNCLIIFYSNYLLSVIHSKLSPCKEALFCPQKNIILIAWQLLYDNVNTLIYITSICSAAFDAIKAWTAALMSTCFWKRDISEYKKMNRTILKCRW